MRNPEDTIMSMTRTLRHAGLASLAALALTSVAAAQTPAAHAGQPVVGTHHTALNDAAKTPQQAAADEPGSPNAQGQREKPMKGKIVAVGAGRNARSDEPFKMEIEDRPTTRKGANEAAAIGALKQQPGPHKPEDPSLTIRTKSTPR
ncbi:MAG: hypothetical protein ACOY5V_01630 [Pseudomonadota bacterium]